MCSTHSSTAAKHGPPKRAIRVNSTAFTGGRRKYPNGRRKWQEKVPKFRGPIERAGMNSLFTTLSDGTFDGVATTGEWNKTAFPDWMPTSVLQRYLQERHEAVEDQHQHVGKQSS